MQKEIGKDELEKQIDKNFSQFYIYIKNYVNT